MKIGFSMGRCINDITLGKVAFEDVLVIITRTKIDKREFLSTLVQEYRYENYITAPHMDALAVAEALWDAGKFHQPRQYGATPGRVHDGVWMDVAPTINHSDEQVTKAWNQYQMLLRLTADNQPRVPSHITAIAEKHAKQAQQERPPIDDDF